MTIIELDEKVKLWRYKFKNLKEFELYLYQTRRETPIDLFFVPEPEIPNSILKDL